MNFDWLPLKNEEIKWILVDFDKTIANSTGFPDFIPQEPIKGCVEALNKLDAMGYKITIFTARAWSDYHNLEKYCDFYKLPVKRIICGKPLAKCLIDDRNVAFNGDWDKAFEDVFKITTI